MSLNLNTKLIKQLYSKIYEDNVIIRRKTAD